MSLSLTIVVIMLLFVNLIDSMSSTITFELHKQYVDDLSFMNIDWVVNDADDRYVDVSVDKWQCDDNVFSYLDDNCTAWY